MTGLKKNLDCSIEDKRKWIEHSHQRISITRQCKLLGLAHSTFYYVPHPESELNLKLMRLIDEQYTRTPFYGVPRITAWLRRQGYKINPKRIARLMQCLGLVAIYPKPCLSKPAPNHRIYPYLLRNMDITEPNQVWAADITYIRLQRGFIYLAAIMDWFSRYVISWELSDSLGTGFCVIALKRALSRGRPDIFNTDQGVQFTSEEFTGSLLQAGIRISMDGRGRVMDNIFVERLWRTVKYEEVYLKDYREPVEVRENLKKYFKFYNQERLHEALGYKTPAEVYF